MLLFILTGQIIVLKERKPATTQVGNSWAHRCTSPANSNRIELFRLIPNITLFRKLVKLGTMFV